MFSCHLGRNIINIIANLCCLRVRKFITSRTRSTCFAQSAGTYSFMDPYINRFISADTIVPDAKDPQSLNRYAYVRNNPMTHT